MFHYTTSFEKLSKLINSSKEFYISGVFLIFGISFGITAYLSKFILKSFIQKIGDYLILNSKISVQKFVFVSSILNNVVFLSIAFFLLIIFGLKLYKLSPGDIGWRKVHGKDWWKILIGIICVPVYNFLFASAAINCIKCFYIKVNYFNFSDLMAYYSVIHLIITIPIIEELVFRGFIQSVLERKLEFIDALLITSVLFTLAHNWRINSWYDAFNYFGIGLIFGLLKKWNGSLWTCTIAHIFLNMSSAFFPITLNKI